MQHDWRDYLTVGALSEECRNMPSSCNVCSTRMSPLPHPHTPGNMWAARCSYVKKLIDPVSFQGEMFRYYAEGKQGRALQCNFRNVWCVGRGRFAAEHWVHSHPDVQPCDLDNDSTFKWGAPAPWHASHMAEVAKNCTAEKAVGMKTLSLSAAPRPAFNYSVGAKHRCAFCGKDLAQRLDEYQFLYKQKPPSTWWGWNFFFK